MRRLLAAGAALAVFATGLAAGVVVSEPGASDGETSAAAAAALVVVRAKDGTTREMSAAEAATRIERLEQQVARSGRARAAVPDADEETGAVVPALPPDVLDVPVPKRPDGKDYTALELRDLARNSSDRTLRLAAIKALRRDDSPEARAILGEVLADDETPLELRVEAAKALAKPPQRDAAPDELVALLASPDLPPEVRREVADGVVRLRERGAWMPDIAAQMAKETDPEVRRLLFESVQRSAYDPAAKAELIGIASNDGASPDERRLAVEALSRQGWDRNVIAALTPLLGSSDAALRRSAVETLARSGRLSLDQIGAALADADPAVRAAAFAARLPTGKNVPKDERNAAIATAVQLATGDRDAAVRRSALAWVGSMPKATANQVLETARNDPDPLVQIEAYTRSPPSYARDQSDRILSQLDSPDPAVRDAAYRLVVRTWNVDVPYRAAWNPRARAAALLAIRAQVATR